MSASFSDDPPDESGSHPLVDRFCEVLSKERNYSPQTVRAYRSDLEDFSRWADRNEVDLLTAGHRALRGYLAELDQAGYSRKTVNRRLSSVRSWYAWLVLAGIRQDNPGLLLSGPKQPRNLPRRISPKEMASILLVHSSYHGMEDAFRRACEMRDQALIEFWYACGSRISESSDLRLCDVDFAQGIVRLFGKGRKERIVPIHPLCVRSLTRYFEEGRSELLQGGDSPYFFVSSRGGRLSPDVMRRMFKKTLREAGVDEGYTPHDVRHTFASDLLDGGADLRSVQEMLGHASLSTTQVYTHVTAERLTKAHRMAHPRAE